jgi:formylglycine-generating enzyme required for sulfatase activity
MRPAEPGREAEAEPGPEPESEPSNPEDRARQELLEEHGFEHPEAVRKGGRVSPSDEAIVEHWEDEYFPFLGFIAEPTFAAPGPLRKRTEAVDLSKEILIPAGMAHIGDRDIPGARPARTIPLPAFYIDRFEVANQRYQEFVRATSRATPYVHENWAAVYNWFRESHPKGLGEVPVVMVTWNDADTYCRWAGRRLPTEEEWERAARGPDGRSWPWGNQFGSRKANLASRLSGPLADLASWDRFEKGWTGSKKSEIAAVGSYPDDRTAENIMDMAGNVSEWVAGTFSLYPGADTNERKGLGSKLRVARGNSWGNRDYSTSMAVRYPYLEDRVDSLIGFRCARDAE